MTEQVVRREEIAHRGQFGPVCIVALPRVQLPANLVLRFLATLFVQVGKLI